MAEYERKPNSWVLFKNNKVKSQTSPHMRGSIVFADGTVKYLVGWKLKDKNGNEYIAGRLNEPMDKNKVDTDNPAKEVEEVKTEEPKTEENISDDSLPF
jgi:hypothetical protein